MLHWCITTITVAVHLKYDAFAVADSLSFCVQFIILLFIYDIHKLLNLTQFIYNFIVFMWINVIGCFFFWFTFYFLLYFTFTLKKTNSHKHASTHQLLFSSISFIGFSFSSLLFLHFICIFLFYSAHIFWLDSIEMDAPCTCTFEMGGCLGKINNFFFRISFEIWRKKRWKFWLRLWMFADEKWMNKLEIDLPTAMTHTSYFAFF